MDKQKLQEAIEYWKRQSLSPQDDYCKYIDVLLDLARSYIRGEVGELMSKDEQTCPHCMGMGQDYGLNGMISCRKCNGIGTLPRQTPFETIPEQTFERW